MARRTKAHRWENNPELLTTIRSPSDMLTKADWNFSRYEDAVFARPCDPETVMFAALDFCIAIISLRDWTRVAVVRQSRDKAFNQNGKRPLFEDLNDFFLANVRWQSAIEAIANTAKHAKYQDKNWPNGMAMPATFVPEFLREEHDACNDSLSLLSFMHKHREVVWWDIALRKAGQEDATPGYQALGDALDDWQTILRQLGLAKF